MTYQIDNTGLVRYCNEYVNTYDSTSSAEYAIKKGDIKHSTLAMMDSYLNNNGVFVDDLSDDEIITRFHSKKTLLLKKELLRVKKELDNKLQEIRQCSVIASRGREILFMLFDQIDVLKNKILDLDNLIKQLNE